MFGNCLMFNVSSHVKPYSMYSTVFPPYAFYSWLLSRTRFHFGCLYPVGLLFYTYASVLPSIGTYSSTPSPVLSCYVSKAPILSLTSFSPIIDPLNTSFSLHVPSISLFHSYMSHSPSFYSSNATYNFPFHSHSLPPSLLLPSLESLFPYV